MTKRLSDLTIKALPTPEAGQRTHFDAQLPGFGVRVSQGGSKSFIVMFGPKRQLRTLGRYPAMSLKEARKEAMRYLSATDTEKGQDGAFLPLTDARDAYLEATEKALRPRTHSGYKRLLTAYLPKGYLGDLTRRAIADALGQLADKPTEQFHAHAAMRSFLNWCVHQGYISQSPMPKHTGAMPKARERVLTDHELATLLQKAPANTFGQLVQALIYTGQRRGELSQLRWEWVGKDIITLPGHITKNRTTHVFPISGKMQELLDSLDRTSPLVFPSETGLVISGWSKFKRQMDAATGTHGYTLHDLRRTFVSTHARIGTPIHVTEKLVNHISGTFGGIVSVYNHHTRL